jgi:pimeloyl-ACP methyl ester carboxylesterase
VVVYVHGLWLQGHEGAWLRRRLGEELGAETRAFRYPSVRADTTENAAALARYLAQIRADELHLVGHSLGGVVILTMFELMAQPVLPAGRIVLLGSPVRGSSAAQRLARMPFGKTILGLTAKEALLGTRERRWAGARDLGIIAGDLALGLGRLTGRMGGPNDGTVLVEETRVPGSVQELRLRVSHSAMPFAKIVARQTAAFLRNGRFD